VKVEHHCGLSTLNSQPSTHTTSLKILIVTPAPPGSRTGNRVTALRWARLLRQLGHRVTIDTQFDGRDCDFLVALHARRSAKSIEHFRRVHPNRPAILALTGTDLYGDIHRNETARRSLQRASRLILLQPHGLTQLPKPLRRKTRVIFQSVDRPRHRPEPLKTVFEVCVIGHLRPVKDPFRAAMSARLLPAESRIRIIQIGSALSSAMEEQAHREAARNSRYRWLGELPHWKTRQRLARSRLLVLSSKLEGGANVISEALAACVPVVSSRISGSIGLLGDDYPGYFPVGDTRCLAELLERVENDPPFYRELSRRCKLLAPLVEPARERESWRQLLAEFKTDGEEAP